MQRMNDDEAWAFLETGERPAVFASVRPDGQPHVVPTWYAVEGRTIVFTTWHTTVKASNLRHDHRVAMTVQDPLPPYDYVALEGTAELIDDLEDCRAISTRLGAKYMGDDRADEFGRRNGVQGELVVRVTPTRIHGFRGVAS
jgi:PPOX class probable F420-dependent enzyme